MTLTKRQIMEMNKKWRNFRLDLWEATRGTDLYFVIDQLVNSMEFYSTERSWLKHMGKETEYPSQQLKKVYKAYYKLSSQKRSSMSFNWEKWLGKFGIKESVELSEAGTGWKLHTHSTIDSKLWREMKYDLRDQFKELVKIGADYGVFENAQGTAKILKQIKRLMDKIS